MRRFRRSKDDRFIIGFCGGIGRYFDIDSGLVRFAYIAVALLTGGVALTLMYFVAWLVFPSEGDPDEPGVSGTALSVITIAAIIACLLFAVFVLFIVLRVAM